MPTPNPATAPLPANSLDEATFIAIYRETIHPLFRTISRHTPGDRPLAEDVVQETYLRALDSWTDRGVPDVPLAWLRTVATNLVRSHHRRATPESVTPDQLNHWLAGSPDRSEAKDAVESLVAWGLAQMEPDRARLIDAFHRQRRSLKQIATEQGRTPKAIERRLSRAREELRRILAPRVEPSAGTPEQPQASPVSEVTQP